MRQLIFWVGGLRTSLRDGHRRGAPGCAKKSRQLLLAAITAACLHFFVSESLFFSYHSFHFLKAESRELSSLNPSSPGDRWKLNPPTRPPNIFKYAKL